jgi:hypothetical protein
MWRSAWASTSRATKEQGHVQAQHAPSSANLTGIALVLAGALAPTLAVGAPTGQGVMQGVPAAPELRINQANAFQPPYLRGSMRHAREVTPTRGIGRAATPLSLTEGRAAALDPLAFSAGDQQKGQCS